MGMRQMMCYCCTDNERISCHMLSIFSVLLQGWDAIEWIIQNSESALS